jgi:hypothetical protein
MGIAQKFWRLLILSGLIALVVFAIYSLREYQKSGIAEKGVITCSGGRCFWSAHIHVLIPIEICGTKYALPKFQGPLSGFHTHGEENVIHWHERLEIDLETQQFLQPNFFALLRVFESLQISANSEVFFGKKDGDACPDGARGSWKVFINGTIQEDWRGYDWKDRDIIFFVFDARNPEEIESRLRIEPFVFPALGEG